MQLRIDHTTGYRFHRPVELTPHLLRLRPRSSPGLHLLQSELTITPEAAVRWNLDAEGNIVGTAFFPQKGDHLLIHSSMVVEQRLTNPYDFVLEQRAMDLPIVYTEREGALLAPYLKQPGLPASGMLADWVQSFFSRGTTLAVLESVNAAIPAGFLYVQRHEHGVRTAEETLSLGAGTCRDFAHLMMEAARHLGIAARYVSGYLCAPADSPETESHTHGWCEFYLPGAGWRGFDPTNGILTDAHHIPVATAVVVGEIPPVEGSYCGEAGLCIGHDVRITARELPHARASVFQSPNSAGCPVASSTESQRSP